MVTLENLEQWLLAPAETERLEFKEAKSKNVLVSQVIGATKEAGLIKADDSASTSTRFARYLPFWA